MLGEDYDENDLVFTVKSEINTNRIFKDLPPEVVLS
jgi:hypothetical protein